MRRFFPMRGGEKAAIAFLVLFSAAAFLPWWREIEIAGMALFGWWMAALMLLSPLLALLLLRRNGG